MRKHVRIIGVIGLICLISLAGCAGREEPVSAGTEGETTAVSVEESQAESADKTEETLPTGAEAPEETAAVREGTPLEDSVLAEYRKLFDEYGTWYSQALTSVYATPAEMDLRALFYNGIPDVDDTLSEEEEELLSQDPSWDEYGRYLDTSRLPAEKMNEVLQQYFGISLEQTDKIGLEEMLYLEEMDCYYIYSGDTNVMRVVPDSGYELADGTIALYYMSDVLTGAEEEYVVTVRPTEDGLQVVSNCPADN